MRKSPPKPKFESGPNCDGCPFRGTSFGFVPPSGDPKTAEYLFLMERPAGDEIASGRNAVGRMGGVFNKLLHSNTPIRRSEQVVANAVMCRPVVWEPDVNGGQRPSTAPWGDHVDVSPSPGQVRECARRYTDKLLGDFKGRYIVALGKIPLQYMLDKPARISTLRGSIYEPGRTLECPECEGEGLLPSKDKKCTACGGRGIQKCPNCNRYKHLRTCGRTSSPCPECDGSGRVPRPPRKCRKCDASGRVSADPENPYVCEKLRSDQLLFTTYHPAMLMRNPTMWPVVERDFSRLTHLEDELVAVQDTVYDTCPTDDATVELLASDCVSVDIETRGSLDPAEGDIICIGATHEPRRGYAFDPTDVRVDELLSKPQIIGQNFVLYDWWWLHHHGYAISAASRIYDTRYLGKLLNPDTPNDLTYLTGEFASPPIRGYWKTKENYRNAIREVVCIDVDATLRVFYGQHEQLHREGRWGIVEDYSVPLSRVVFNMRVGGMRINKEKMKDASSNIKQDLSRRRRLLPDWGGARSENQHAEVQRYLYDKLCLPAQKKKATGQRTADSQALEELRTRIQTGHGSIKHLDSTTLKEAVGFINLVLELRDLSKLESSFLRYRLSASGFVHPALNMAGTATFRFSCEHPNAQQIPDCKCKKDPVWGPKLKALGRKRCLGENPNCMGARGIFIPDYDDWEVISVDLKQAEVVGFLWFAEEWDVLNNVLNHGFDAHQMLANKILGREATEGERDTFKTGATFPILYGEDERTTAARLGRSLEEIKEARSFYFKMLPGVSDYRKRMVYHAQNHGYVESPFGFRRYVRVQGEIGRGANQACNHPIQNIPPVVIGRSMIKLAEQLPSPARLWMQVHDELLVTYPRHLRDEVRSCVVDNLRSPVAEMAAAPIKMAAGIRFNCDVEVGPNWGEMEEMR